MTSEILLNIIQTNFNRNETFFRLALPVKLSLKSKMHNTVKLETQDQRPNSLKGNCSAKLIKVHYPVDKRHMNFLYMFTLGCVSTGWGESYFHMVGETGTNFIALKNHFITPNPIRWKGDNWASSHYIFRNLNYV